VNPRLVAALFVDPKGPYVGLPGVEVWDEQRDARLYAGPFPVVAHPPCERWGRYATGGPSAKVRRVVGDDGGCFAAALAAVRRWGGVLEHPADSKAWAAHELVKPPPAGGWVKADGLGGFTCRVDQGQYGHRARKATWLYAFGALELPELRWARVVGRPRLDAGFHSAEERRAARARDAMRVLDRLTPRECKLTPVEFRDDVLLPLARSVQ
jgi:hypothetical protein